MTSTLPYLGRLPVALLALLVVLVLLHLPTTANTGGHVVGATRGARRKPLPNDVLLLAASRTAPASAAGGQDGR